MKRYRLILDTAREIADNDPMIRRFEARTKKPLSFGLTFSAPNQETAETIVREGLLATSGSIGAWHLEEVSE